MRLKEFWWDTVIVYIDGKISSTHKDSFVLVDQYSLAIINIATDRSVIFTNPKLIFLCRDRLEVKATEQFIDDENLLPGKEREVFIKAQL